MPAGDAAEVDYRVSDAERERAVARLRGAHAEGRLSFEEFEARVDEAYQARSVSALEAVLRDLPPESQQGAKPRPRRRRRLPLLGWWLRVNGICIAVWAATSIGSRHDYFWPMWVILGTTIPLVAGERSARHRGARGIPGLPSQPPPVEADESPKRVLTSVLFVDIVESTERAAAAGDAAWNQLVDSYQQAIQGDLVACGGHEVFTKGDEVVAAFPTAAAAVRCGSAVREHAHQLDLEVRIGVHAGEVDQHGHAMRGIAMHVGQRVCASAQPGELLVSSTVHDLLVGSGLKFRDTGEHQLKGFASAWRLYALED
ncbi:MAG: DUF1707 domain-containing protein [Mycobacteriales bacterium]